MRTIPSSMLDTWVDGDFTGQTRPMARVTIQPMQIQLTKVDPEKLFSSAIFGQGNVPVELPNVKSVSWDRSVGSDVATATIIFYNTAPLPLGETPVTSGDLDLPGAYTFNYGTTSWSTSRWGHAAEPAYHWRDLIVPDRLVRTYEGYGFDATSIPEEDPNLVQTGVWLIDDVEFTHDGLITVTARDIGRLLLDQIMFPPVIPLANYPLQFRSYFYTNNPPVITTTGTTVHPTYQTDSGVPYNGSNGSIYGHRPSHAFDSNNSTYWLSIGNDRPNGPYSYEFVQGTVGGATVGAIRYKVFGGPYRVFASVKVGGVWKGRSNIPYDPNNPVSAPNGANIRYVAVQNIAREGSGTFTFTTPYTAVQSVRLTFTSLYNSHLGPYPYRAGVREISVSSSHTTSTPGGTTRHGEYGDYTEIVKYLLASGGFYWPKSAAAFQTYSDGNVLTSEPSTDDPYLTKGRVWGDLEMSGTHGIATLGNNGDMGVGMFDKKPLMDGIAAIRDILGFIFFIDETGGAVFRLPNIWQVGNFIGDNAANAGWTTDVLTIDEKQTLIGLRARLSSRNIREQVFISNTTGKIGAVAAGYNPINPNPGLRRVAGWTDQNFQNATECQKMADLITVRQMFEYRSDTLQIVACPAIQIDDQVRIYERTTNEGYLHYVKGIKSTNDLEKGSWVYDVTTHWLGEEPYASWAFDPASLSNATKAFLATLGRYTADGGGGSGGGAVAIVASITSFALDTGTEGKVDVTGTASGGIGPYTYSWSFGDGGAVGTGASTSHTYASDGTYTIRLTVTDTFGNVDTDTVVVRPYGGSSGTLGDDGGSGTQQTGSGITLWGDLTSTAKFSTKVNTAGTGTEVSFPSGTFTFSNFSDGDQTIHVGANCYGALLTNKGLLGAGSAHTTIQMVPSSSNKAGDVPTVSPQTNQVQYMKTQTNGFVLDGVKIQGTTQGHLYNGFSFANVDSPVVNNVTVAGIPGNSGGPPGETFMLNFYKSTGTATVTNLTVDGQNIAAAGVGSNNTTAHFVVTNFYAKDMAYSAAWASWEQQGTIDFHGFVTENCCRNYNAERHVGRTNFYDPIWCDPFSGHYDINYTWETGWTKLNSASGLYFYFSDSAAWDAFVAGRTNTKIKIVCNSHGLGNIRATVKVYVAGVQQTTTDYVAFTGS